MDIFVYWNNKKHAHEAKLFECQAESILEADQLFEAATGNVAARCNWVGCEIKPVTSS